MSTPLRVLLVEDSEDDALLLIRQLRRGGYDLTCERVDTAAAMAAALEQQTWDFVISDYVMPRFTALDALALLQKSGLDLPFIIVSGAIGEGTAVEAMKAGANDYVMKDNLARLLPAIERELREAEVRRERKQAEEQLRFQAQLLDGVRESVVATDLEGHVVYWGKGAEALYGYSAGEAMGKLVTFIVEPQVEEEEQQRVRQVRETGSWRGQCWQKRKDGTSFWADTVISLVTDQNGQPSGLIGIDRDITERKQAEEEIRRRNRELALLNRVIAASAATPSVEPEAVLETACRELALTLGVPQAAVAMINEEKTAAVVVAEYLAEGRPTGLHETIPIEGNSSFQYLLKHKAPLAVDDAQNDPRLGPIHDLLRRRGTVSLLILPLLIEDEVVGSLGLDDIEPRHFSVAEVNLAQSVADQVAGAVARARLAQTRQLLITAIEQADETVIITDTNDNIVYVNPAFERISGYSRAEVVGQKPLILSSGKHDDRFFQEMWATITSGQVWHGRIINKKKDGTLYTEETSISPIRGKSGDIVNFVEVKRDVTRELQLEEQYHQAQKMESIGRLAGGVAHDFNNLLTGIMGYAGLTLRALSPADPIRPDLEGIQRNADRAAELTRQLLTFARHQMIEPRVLNLNELILNLDKMLRRLISEDIELVTLPAPELGRVKVDPGQMEQVLLNLAVNARDAMPDGGKLTVETANVTLDRDYAERHAEVVPGEYVLLAVSDTGTGMAEEVRTRIFEPFFTTKEVGKGTGLGLATVFGIVKQSQGHIWVYSEPDVGTTFKIYLPRVEGAVDALPRYDRSLVLPRGVETILLVEDEAAVRDLAARVLREQGYTVLEAANGEEALRLVQEYQGEIQLLCTDVVMPQMGGKVLVDRLGDVRPNVRVLFTSGYTDNGLSHYGILDSGIPFLQKPFSPEALARKVREVLDNQEPQE